MGFLLVAAWVASGGASFVYWWTRDFDLTARQLPTLVAASIAGPISFILGWFIHGGSSEGGGVIVKRREDGQ
jgi:hypothetical protein